MNRVEVYDSFGQLDFTQELPSHVGGMLNLAEVMRERFYWVPCDPEVRGVVDGVGVLLDKDGNILQGPIVALAR